LILKLDRTIILLQPSHTSRQEMERKLSMKVLFVKSNSTLPACCFPSTAMLRFATILPTFLSLPPSQVAPSSTITRSLNGAETEGRREGKKKEKMTLYKNMSNALRRG